MQGYVHLSRKERYHIEMLRRAGVSGQRIAAGMN